MDAKDLRVSDAEREHVGRILQRAVGQGLITIAEFTERMDTAMGARTRGELNSVLIDLPGIQVPGQPYPPPPGYGPPPGGAYGSAAETSSAPTLITGTMSSIARRGTWEVPGALALRTRFCSTTLDFNRAVVHTQFVHIDIDDFCSSATFILPPEATADCDGIESFACLVDSKVRTRPQQGAHHFVVRGRIKFGSLTVRYPYGTTFKRLMS
jgi:hypothetical protein